MKKLLALLVVFSILFSFSVAFADIIIPGTESGNTEKATVAENVSGEEKAPTEEKTQVEEPAKETTTETAKSGEQSTIMEPADTVVEETKNPSPVGGIVAIVVVVIIVALVVLVSRGN